jgi:hypothetical protein
MIKKILVRNCFTLLSFLFVLVLGVYTTGAHAARAKINTNHNAKSSLNAGVNTSGNTNTNAVTSKLHKVDLISPQKFAKSSNNSSVGESALTNYDAPLSVKIGGDNLTSNGYFAGIQYVQKISNAFAIGAIVEYGKNMYRVNVTAGFNIGPKQHIKFSAERLNQLLPFGFSTGNIETRMYQNAYGMQYSYTLDENSIGRILRNINVGAHYSNTPNKSLDPIAYSTDLYDYVVYRNLAGAITKGLYVGSDIKLASSAMLTARVHYDDVHYKTEYTADSSYNRKGIGGALELTKLFGERIKFIADASVRKIYKTYKAGIYWLPPLKSKLGLEVGVVGQHLVSSNSMPSSSGVMLQVGMTFADRAKYQLPIERAAAENVVSWTKKPAVYMERVLAVAEEKTTSQSRRPPIPTGPAPRIDAIVNNNSNSSPGDYPECLVSGNVSHVKITGVNFVPGYGAQTTIVFAYQEYAPGQPTPDTLQNVVVVDSQTITADIPGRGADQFCSNYMTPTFDATAVITNPDGKQSAPLFPFEMSQVGKLAHLLSPK